MPPIAGILAPTTQTQPKPAAPAKPEIVAIAAADDDGGQGGETPVAAEPRTPRVRRKGRGATPAEKLEGRRLYLSEAVHFRLRMLAYQRGRKLSEVAEEILDRGLPKYDVNRVG